MLARRLPAGLPVAVARSRCDSCGRTLGAAELVPVLSYLAMRGRCRGCGAPIGQYHLWFELAAVAAAAWVLAVEGGPAAAWAGCALGWTLLPLAAIDWRHGRLPDVLTLPLLLAGLCVTWWLDPQRILNHAVGAAVGYAVLRLVAAGYRAWRGRDGLGEGDAKLLAAAGAWVGLDQLSLVMLGGAALTLPWALWRARGQWRGTVSVPFGPGLALALWLVRLHG